MTDEEFRILMLTQQAADNGSEVDRQQLQSMPHLGGGQPQYSPEDVVRLSPENYPMAERRSQDVDPEVVRGGETFDPYSIHQGNPLELARPPQDLSMEDQIAGRAALAKTPLEAYASDVFGSDVRNLGVMDRIGLNHAM